MATGTLTYDVESIGNMAGVVWGFLAENGPTTFTRLAKEIDAPRDLIMQGVGWLAREGKVQFEETARSKLISLC